ncbi:MAG: ArsR family transcriptional regulator [Actinobacteria bacterium]|nr:MAG: ArsR family transcriptional regulator [Actinomycetota bacterium]
MPDAEQTKKRSALFDRMTVMMETLGFPHLSARIYAALMLAEGEGLSTSQLVEKLEISKASVSTSTQLLLAMGLVERYRVRNSREAHFRLLKGIWGPLLAKKFEAMTAVTNTAREALAMAETDTARVRLQEMYDVYSFFEQECQTLMKHWRERGMS